MAAGLRGVAARALAADGQARRVLGDRYMEAMPTPAIKLAS